MSNAAPSAADFCQVYDQCVERVYRYHLVRTGSPAAAEELTADTFFAAWESFGSFREDGADSGAAAWLIGIARHKLADHFRRSLFRGQPRSVPLEAAEPLPSPGPSPETLAAERLELARVAAALRRLNSERAEALALHYFAGLPLAEVGRAMNKSEEAAKKLVQRGLSELRQMLRVAQGSAEVDLTAPARSGRANR